jgi:outer membrane protein TolC
MTTPSKVAIHTSGAVAMVVAAVFVFTSCVFAQGGSVSGQSLGVQANPLPLSGRIGQNGSVKAVQTPVPGTTSSVDTLNPSVQVQGPYSGSTNGLPKMPFSGSLSFREAIERGLAYNLGAIGLAQEVRQAHGQSRVARSALLPNINGDVAETVEQENLKALGLRFSSPIPGIQFPTIVGPFNFIDLRARLSQTVVDLSALNNYRAANATLRANRLSAQDARDVIVLAVGGAYLQAIAANARVQSARAQSETASALYQQTLQKRGVGLVAQIDVDRGEVEASTQQQRLVSLQNDLAKQKINLARMTGLPPTDQYQISDDVPFSAAPALTLEEALKQAFEQRSDLKAAGAQAQAAELARAAARDERLPSLSVSGDYGAIGTNPSQSHGTFTAVATLRIPVWEGGRTEGDIEQADAALTQRRAEFEDMKGQVESDVRGAYLDLDAATTQVGVAQKNIEVAKEALNLARQRFEAGVTENLEVVQAQESATTAEFDYINSVFAHNVAKLTLARATGRAAEKLPQFLELH